MGGIPSAIDFLKQRDQRIRDLEAALRAEQEIRRGYELALKAIAGEFSSQDYLRLHHIDPNRSLDMQLMLIAQLALGEGDTTP